MIYEVTVSGNTHQVELTRAGRGWRCKLDGRELALDAVSTQNGVFSILLDGKSYEAKQEITPAGIGITVGHECFRAVVQDPRSLRSRQRTGTAGQGMKKLSAPMPGKVVRILASAGDAVEAGQGILVIEAMKMQNELKSPKTGILKKLNAAEGATVETGQVLAEIE